MKQSQVIDYIEVTVCTEEEIFIGYSNEQYPLNNDRKFLTLHVDRSGFSTINIKVSDIKYFIVNVVTKGYRSVSDTGRTIH